MSAPICGRVLGPAVLLMWAIGGTAQSLPTPPPPSARFDEFHHTRWTGAESAPLDVRALAQTPDGWLWLGSGSGLYRFDGARFERFPPATEAATLPIESLTVLPSGGLWIGFQAGGIAVLDDGRLTLRDQDKGIAPHVVGGFAEDLDGGIWAVFGTVPQRFVDGEWQTIDERWGFSSKSADSVAVDTEGTVWISHSEGVSYLARSTSAFVHIPMAKARYDFVAGPDGALWLVSKRGVERAPLPTAGSRKARVHEPPGGHSHAALFDRSHGLWSVWCDGVCRVRQPQDVQENRIDVDRVANERYLRADGLSSDSGLSLLEDHEGTVWVGTRNGLDRFRRNRFVRMAMPAGAMNFLLAPTSDGMLLGHWHKSKPQLWRTRGVQLQAVEDVGPDITSATRTHRGAIWLAGPQHLWHGDGNTFRRFAIPPLVPDPWIRSIAEDASGLWVCFHRGGLYRFERNAWHRVEANPLPGRAPAAITVDAQQRSWFGFRDNRVAVLDGDSARTYTAADGLTVGTVVFIYVDRHVLVGGDRGLALWVHDRFHTLKAADPDVLRGVTGIVSTPMGELWLNGARGVVRMDNEQIELAKIDPGRELALELFDILDGVPGVARSFPTSPTAHTDADGRLWFAGTDGVAWIHPERIARNHLKPSVQILRVRANGERHDQPHAALQLRSGTRNVQIDYTALSLAIPERVRFRYRLDGADTGWQDVGTRRQAFYSNLGSGSYRFRVLASNNDGLWNEEGATLQITIAPTFFETPWFTLLCVLAAGGFLWLAYAVRLRQVTGRLRARWQERLAERERIARELHDTFLQSTFALSLKVESAIADIPENHPARKSLEQALDRADGVAAEGRKRLYDLRTVETSAQHLGAVLEALGAQLTPFHHARLTVRVAGQTNALSPIVGEELLQIGREALTNAFHHANAKHIEVAIECHAHATVLRIVDDGKGIDPDILASGGRADHWGLTGMRERARRIGARFELRAGSPHGMEVYVSVPAHLAYGPEQGRLRRWLSLLRVRARIDRSE